MQIRLNLSFKPEPGVNSFENSLEPLDPAGFKRNSVGAVPEPLGLGLVQLPVLSRIDPELELVLDLVALKLDLVALKLDPEALRLVPELLGRGGLQ